MQFISKDYLIELLKDDAGHVEVECVVAPHTVPSSVAGEWLVYYVSKEKHAKRQPLITTTRNPALRRPKRVLGIFSLLYSLGIAPISIPTKVGQVAIQTYDP